MMFGPPFLSSPCKPFSLILASLVVVDNASLGCAVCVVGHLRFGGGFSWAVWPVCVFGDGRGKGERREASRESNSHY